MQNFNPFISRYPKRKTYIEKIINPLSDQYIKEHLSQPKKGDIISFLSNNKSLFLYYDKGELGENGIYDKFSQYKNIPTIIVKNLEILNIKELTPIQKLTFSYFFNYKNMFDSILGHDLIGCSQTGSGKTIAYLIPIISDLLNNPEKVSMMKIRKNFTSFPLILVILPTRELALQTYKEFLKILKGTYISTVCVYGGEKQYNQMEDLKYGCDILIATTGRLLDFLSKNFISLSEVQYLVIDEADKLLDMGFEEDINQIIYDFDLPNPKKNNNNNNINSKNNMNYPNLTTLLFSATFTSKVVNVINAIIKPGYVYINSSPSLFDNEEANGNVIQRFYLIEGRSYNIFKLKILNLIKILQLIKGKTIVFSNTKTGVESISNELYSSGFGFVSIHGDYDMIQRKEAMTAFAGKESNLMIATDVLSRGIDIPNVEYVINFDMPNDFRQYIHRIGRTGRVGNKGNSITFLTYDDKSNFKNIENLLIKNKQNVPDFIKNVL